jgi:carboxyl-terminal processing protease
MVVLVNRYSASASEIVSACLQDHQRAMIVGERTWGKGSVQNIIELEGGKSALKLTTAGYHRPNGKNIHRFPGATPEDEWGVKPNTGYEVRFSLKELQDLGAYRRKIDVLRKDNPRPEGEEAPQFDDRQLNKALDFLFVQLSEAEAKKDEKGKDAGKSQDKKE